MSLDELRSKARAWADAHDGRSLREIRDARAALYRANARSKDACFALALARLLDLEGATPELQRALARVSSRDPVTLAQLALAQGRLAWERGELLEAERAVSQAYDIAQRADGGAIVLEVRIALARLAQVSPDTDEAARRLAALETALVESRERRPWHDASAEMVRASAKMAAGHKADARSHLESALSLALGYRGDLEAAVIAGMLGNVEHDLGDPEAAARWYEVAIRRAARMGSDTTHAIFTGYRGWALHERGEHAKAALSYRRAIALCRESGLARFEAHFRALAAVLAPTARIAARREMELSAALAALERTGDHERAAALTVLRAILHADLARREPDARRAVVGTLRAASALERAPTASDDARIARRMASAAVARAIDAIGARADEVRVAPRGEAFAIGDRVVSLEHCGAPRMILARLLESWVDDRAASDDELRDAAWPGERMVARAATHRLHVAISTLRAAGLGARVQRVDGGYRLAVESLGLMRAPIESD